MKKIYIGRSNIAGRGILAKELIRKGDFILGLRGKLHRRHYTAKSQYRNEETWIPVAIHWWVNPGYPFRYLNHSCNPSAGFKTPRRVYAMRDIQKDEEITVDYSTIEYVGFWSMPCSCGSKICRKTVRPIQKLPEKTFRRYLPYIPRFIQKVYQKYHPAL